MTEAAHQVVVPNGLANVEGNSSTSEPFTSTSFRFQQVFDASQFAIPLGSSGRIESISFRLDSACTNDAVMFFGGSSVQLSTTQHEPDTLSSVFAENRGADAVTLFNGAISFGGLCQPGATTQPFHATLGATTPFFYIPSQGNLLQEIRGGSGQAFLPGFLDVLSETRSHGCLRLQSFLVPEPLALLD